MLLPHHTCNVCQSVTVFRGEHLTFFQWFLSEVNGASSESLTQPITSLLRSKSRVYAVKMRPKFSSVRDMQVWILNTNNSLNTMPFLLFFGLASSVWRTRCLEHSCTVTNTAANEKDKFEWENSGRTRDCQHRPLHYTTLHYTLHYTTLH